MKRATPRLLAQVSTYDSHGGPSPTLPHWAYTCPELGRTCARPGAYDAFELPSLIGSDLHYPDGRVVKRAERTAP